MKKFLMIMAFAALLLPAKNIHAADPEIVEVMLGSDIGKAVVNSGYNADYEQDNNNPLCYTFTNLLKPARISIQASWYRVGSDEPIQGVPGVEIETPILKKGEKKRICFEAPKNIKGKIRLAGFYGIYE